MFIDGIVLEEESRSEHVTVLELVILLLASLQVIHGLFTSFTCYTCSESLWISILGEQYRSVLFKLIYFWRSPLNTFSYL